MVILHKLTSFALLICRAQHGPIDYKSRVGHYQHWALLRERTGEKQHMPTATCRHMHTQASRAET